MQLLALVLGFLAWSLAEYSVHRFVLHRPPFSRSHFLHHRDPGADVGVPLGIALPALIIFDVLCAWAFGRIGLAFALGFGLAYVLYVYIHGRSHHAHTGLDQPKRWPLTYLMALHDQHHAGKPGNFGVTSPLFDLLFGTYVAPLPKTGT